MRGRVLSPRLLLGKCSVQISCSAGCCHQNNPAQQVLCSCSAGCTHQNSCSASALSKSPAQQGALSKTPARQVLCGNLLLSRVLTAALRAGALFLRGRVLSPRLLLGKCSVGISCSAGCCHQNSCMAVALFLLRRVLSPKHPFGRRSVKLSCSAGALSQNSCSAGALSIPPARQVLSTQ